MNGDPRFMDNAEVQESQTKDKTSTSAAASTPEAATFDARKLVTIELVHVLQLTETCM